MLTPANPSYIANETIYAGSRVKFISGSVVKVELADAGDAEIGTAILHGGQEYVAAGYPITINLIGNPGGRTFRASAAITAGDTIYRAADGKVASSGSGDAIGIAAESAAADGDFIDGIVQPATSAAGSGTADGLVNVRLARATFDPSANSGERTIGAHGLGVTLPDNAIITRAWFDVVTTFTSATDAGTIAFMAEGAGDLQAALAISDARNMFDAGIHAGLPGHPNLGADAAHDSAVEVAALFAATNIKLTAARELTATVAVEALTAGKAVLFVEYVISA